MSGSWIRNCWLLLAPVCTALPAAEGAPMTVQLVEPTGSETLVQGEVAGTKVQVQLRERLKLVPGDRLGLSIAAEDLHLFDPETEQRVDILH